VCDTAIEICDVEQAVNVRHVSPEDSSGEERIFFEKFAPPAKRRVLICQRQFQVIFSVILYMEGKRIVNMKIDLSERPMCD